LIFYSWTWLLDLTAKYFKESDLNENTWYACMLGIDLNVSIAIQHLLFLMLRMFSKDTRHQCLRDNLNNLNNWWINMNDFYMLHQYQLG